MTLSAHLNRNPGLDQLVLLPFDELPDVELLCGRTLEDFVFDGPLEPPHPAIAFLVNGAVAASGPVMVISDPEDGLMAGRQVFESRDYFEYAVQHLEVFVIPMLCLHTRFMVGPDTLEDDLELRNAQVLSALGACHTDAIRQMAGLWWMREQYARRLAGHNPPSHIEEALAIIEEVTASQETPEHLVARAAPDIIALAERYASAMQSAGGEVAPA